MKEGRCYNEEKDKGYALEFDKLCSKLQLPLRLYVISIKFLNHFMSYFLSLEKGANSKICFPWCFVKINMERLPGT